MKLAVVVVVGLLLMSAGCGPPDATLPLDAVEYSAYLSSSLIRLSTVNADLGAVDWFTAAGAEKAISHYNDIVAGLEKVSPPLSISGAHNDFVDVLHDGSNILETYRVAASEADMGKMDSFFFAWSRWELEFTEKLTLLQSLLP